MISCSCLLSAGFSPIVIGTPPSINDRKMRLSVLINNIAFAAFGCFLLIPVGYAQVAQQCVAPPLPADCSTPNRKSSQCRVEALATIGAQCPLGLLVTVTGIASGGDYLYPIFTNYLHADGLDFLPVAEKMSPGLSTVLESRFGAELFPGRGGNFKQEGWTSLSDLYDRFVEVKGDELCLTLGASYPFAGKLQRCTDGTTFSTLRTAEGVPTWAEARGVAAELLLAHFQLDVTNAEHFEGRQPRSFDAISIANGAWHLVMRYEGRRRVPPYWTYVVTIPLYEKKAASVTKQPWR